MNSYKARVFKVVSYIRRLCLCFALLAVSTVTVAQEQARVTELPTPKLVNELKSVKSRLKVVVLSAEEKARLAAGEALTRVWKDKSYSDGAMDVFGSIDIKAPLNVIWAVMMDCQRHLDLVLNMTVCEVIEVAPDGSWDIRRQKLRVARFLPKTVSVFRSDYDINKSIKITLIGGDMKVQDGLWTLTYLGETRTRVTYRARVKPKFPVPGNLLRRATRKDVPEVMKRLRRESEADFNALQNPYSNQL